MSGSQGQGAHGWSGGDWGPPYPPRTPAAEESMTGYLPPAYGAARPAPPRRRRRGGAVGMSLLLVAAVGAGIGIDHVFWRPSAPAPAAAGGGPAAQPGRSLQPGAGGGTADPTLPTAPGAGAGTGAGASGGASAVTAEVEPELVIINVTLGYQDVQAAGTGMVLTSTGDVLTNNHVISGATRITATDVGNGRSYTASVVGYDSAEDMAVIRLQDASGLSTVQLGSSAKAAVGDAVTAIGNAGGTSTLTAASGTVTATNQTVTGGDDATGASEQLDGLLQVDADVQPGDSGGPLVNASGAVIGMDTLGSASSRFQQSPAQGFALPIDALAPLARQIESGTASAAVHVGATAFLGVEVNGSDDTGGGDGSDPGGGSGASGGSGTETAGALVAGVISGSPAARTPLAEGDVITSVGGRPVADSAALSAVMGTHHPGDKVTVVWTDPEGAQQSTSVVLAAGPAT